VPVTRELGERSDIVELGDGPKDMIGV